MLEDAFKEISQYLRYYNYGNEKKMNIKNSSGDIIKEVDYECEKIIINHIKRSALNIVGYISEETKLFVPLNIVKYLKSKLYSNEGDKQYIIAFDPLDGSSNMNSNNNVGTIYAIYEYDPSNYTIKNIIKAGYCLYGHSTIMVETHYDEVLMKQLDINGNFVLSKKININNNDLKTKIISINHEEYEPEINFLKNQYRMMGYKHRWSGTIVADIHRLLINDGLFFYTSGTRTPHGKIRFLYEAIPMAFIFHKAGGIGLNESYLNILETIKNYKIEKIHKKTSIILCSNNEYKKMINLLEIFNNTKY